MNNLMNLHAVAGYCHETILWRLLAGVCQELLENPERLTVLTPERVCIDGEHFVLNDDSGENTASEFDPPEGKDGSGEAGAVWSLGALVCYASSGHNIFGGRGGAYQRSHPTVELPVLRKEHAALTPLVQRCLCYSPGQRISLADLCRQACKGLAESSHRPRTVADRPTADPDAAPVSFDDIWPEKMG